MRNLSENIKRYLQYFSMFKIELKFYINKFTSFYLKTQKLRGKWQNIKACKMNV